MSAAPRRTGPGSALLGMLGVALVAGLMLAVGVVPAIALTGMGAKSGIGLFETLPDSLKIANLQQKTEIYALRDKKPALIASFYNQNREVVGWDEVPDTVKNAALAAEDVRYYEHGGVDPMGILRALVSNATSGGTQGASTISQQYVKNVCIQDAELLPTQEDVQAAYAVCTGGVERKLREARLAIGLEKRYNKDEILLGYLNIAGFGGRIYGIEVAAQYYYDTHAKDLTPAQAASLMAIVNSPNDLRIDVKTNIEKNQARRDYILRSELEHGMLTKKQHDEAVATKVEPKITPTTTGCAAAKSAGFFCNYIVNTILNDPAFGKDRGARYNALQSSGWKIYTTLDLGLQRKAKEAMSASVPAKSPEGMNLGGAAVSVEVGTGRIISMVQSKRFDESGGKGTGGAGYTATSVNYNADKDFGSSGGFQPGSTYKAFTLINWLQNGHGLYEQVDGNARTIPAGAMTICDAPSTAPWAVGNDAGDGGGYMSVLDGTMRSTNGVFASMAQQLDICSIRDTAASLGVHRADGAELEAYAPTILGTNEVAPLSMAIAYAGIANQGEVCSPVAIDRIVASNGKDVAVPAANCKRAIPKSVAIAAGYALNKVLTGGTASADSGAVGGAWGFAKTGTTDDAKDTWVVGGTTKTTTAVWVGNVKGETNLRNVYGFPGCSSQASSARHCIWSAIQAANLTKYKGDTSWPEPEQQYLYGKRVAVPDVTGQTTDEAKAALQGAGFRVKVGEPSPSDVEAGRVAGTDPGAGSQVSQGAEVTIVPSSGPAPEPAPEPVPVTGAVPALEGTRIQDARGVLAAAGFTQVQVQWFPEVQSCVVIDQTPDAGTPGDPASTVVSLAVAGAEDQCQ